MIKEIGSIELENGFIFKFWSDKFGKSFYVVQFNDWGYINIFDESKERIAVTSLLDRDIACQDRDGNLPMNILSEEEEIAFQVYCNYLEKCNFDYELAEQIFFGDVSLPF